MRRNKFRTFDASIEFPSDISQLKFNYFWTTYFLLYKETVEKRISVFVQVRKNKSTTMIKIIPKTKITTTTSTSTTTKKTNWTFFPGHPV